MSFGDDVICQSLEYRFGEAVSLGAFNQWNISNHSLAVGCSGVDRFGRHNFGVPDFGRHYTDFGVQHQSAVAWSNNITHDVIFIADTDINSKIKNMLDLATVSPLFSIKHSIDSNKPLHSKK
jgi:hypothetical protein